MDSNQQSNHTCGTGRLASLRPVTHQGPPHLKEEQGQQSQHIFTVLLPKPFLQLVKLQGKHTDFKMSQKEIIYMNISVSNSMRQDKRHETCKRREWPWHTIAGSLRIICLLLLLTNAVLGYLFFQCSSGCKIQDDKHRNEENASSSAAEDHSVLPPREEKDCDIYEGKWSCSGNNCYYFSTEEKTWHESKKSCQQRGSNLIKIEEGEEQRFVQSKIKYSYWVGLHKNGTDHPWLWHDGTNLSWKLKFHFTTPSTTDAICGRLKNTDIVDAVCTKEFYYICKK